MLVMVRAARRHAVARSPLTPRSPAFPRSDERKVFDGPSELQLDCVVEESSRSAPLKLALTHLSRPDDFPAPPHNGPALPVEPGDIKLDPAAADTPAGSGERGRGLMMRRLLSDPRVAYFGLHLKTANGLMSVLWSALCFAAQMGSR